MPTKAEHQFIRNFGKVLALVKSGKIKGVQLRLGEKPGQTIANKKESV